MGGGGTAVAQWLRRCATNRKVAGSIPDCVIGIFHWHNPSNRTMALGSTQPLTEMSTRSISWGGKDRLNCSILANKMKLSTQNSQNTAVIVNHLWRDAVYVSKVLALLPKTRCALSLIYCRDTLRYFSLESSTNWFLTNFCHCVTLSVGLHP